jgi:hypothetical protein
MRRELDVRLALSSSLEQRVVEQHEHSELQERHIAAQQRKLEAGLDHVEHLTRMLDAERRQAAEDRRSADEALEAERERTADALQVLGEVQETLAAERRRASYVMVQRLTERVGRHPALAGWLKRAAARVVPR